MSLLQKVKDFNSGRGVVAIILTICGVVGAFCAVVGTIYAIFFSGQSSNNAQQIGVKIVDAISTAGDHSPVIIGDHASVIMTKADDEFKAKYITSLEQRIDETKKQLADKQATINGLRADNSGIRADNSGIRADNTELRADIKVLKSQLRDLQAKLDNPEQDLKERLQALVSAERNLRELQSELPAEKFNEALSALANGDTSKADQLLAQVEADAQKHVLRAAKAAYQRGLIADNEVRYHDANKHFTKAINLDADNADYLNQVAVLRDKMGLYQEAEPMYRQALAIRKQTLGENHTLTATSYNNIATNLDDQGRYEEAEPLHQKALAIHKQTLGENHPSTATSYNNIAYNLGKQGRYKEAEPLYRQALAIDKQTLGENHPATATSYNNIASNLGKQGRYEEAEPLFEKAIAIMEAASLADHPNTQVMKNSLRVLQEKIKR
jgi:tetratricopeptide (TPR) repeat protein